MSSCLSRQLCGEHVQLAIVLIRLDPSPNRSSEDREGGAIKLTILSLALRVASSQKPLWLTCKSPVCSIATISFFAQSITMGQPTEELNTIFASSLPSGLPKDVLGELQSVMRLHSITPQELFYKWESYSLKMGSEETRLELDTVRLFKKDVQEALERGSRTKAHIRSADKRGNVGVTPRSLASNSDVFGMYVRSGYQSRLALTRDSRLDDLVPNTPHDRATNEANGSVGKRKSDFQTPSVSKVSRTHTNGTPSNFKTPHTTANGASDNTQYVDHL